MPNPWNPDQYERFKAERAQPFHDLLASVQPSNQPSVVDLGCGTGELTRHLHESLGARKTLGIDSSPSMLAKAQAQATSTLHFELREIENLQVSDRYDVIFSNAALHWCSDHPALFAALATRLAPRGQLAVQMPANADHPSHQIAAALFDEPRFQAVATSPRREWPVLPPRTYAELLHRLGFAEQSVRLEVYGHVLEDAHAVVEWTRGTLLTDYEKKLPAEAFAEFLETYRKQVVSTLGDARPYFYPFSRILLWARR